MTEIAIEARNLRKRFHGGVDAVNGVDLEIPRGTVYGLLGRNGAGKTTTLRLLMALLRPTAGEARILGRDLWTAGPGHRARVAYVAQAQRLHDWMTTRELCFYVSHFYGTWDDGLAESLARRFEVPVDRPVGALSGGEQRKVAALLALAARPEVLLLDEPAAGLDPVSRRELLDALIDAIGRTGGMTIVLSTHLVGDLERLAESVGVMEKGRLVFSERLDLLQAGTKRVQVIFEGAAPPAGFQVPGAIRTETSGPVVTALARICEEELAHLQQTPGARVSVFPVGLEEFFVERFGPQGSVEQSEEKT